MYTIYCKNQGDVSEIVLLLAENGIQCNVVENQSVDDWMVLPASGQKLTSKGQVESFLRENKKTVLHD